MKKLLIICSFLLIGIASQAQFGSAATFPLAKGDTLNNVDTVAKVITATTGYNAIGIQVNVNVLSGTLAGKVYLYASMDNRNYSLIDSASYASVPAGATNSVFGPSAGYTNVAVIKEIGVPFTHYLVAPTSSGTVSAQVRVSYTLRKYSTQ